ASIHAKYAHTASTEKNSRESIEPCNKEKTSRRALVFTYWFLSYYRAKARAPKHEVICGEARRKERRQ
ncbi:MAG: hypothetical protein ACLR9S_07910, partial [Lachnospiraceae bacterium]